MSRGRQASVEQTRTVQQLVWEGFTAAQIFRELEQNGLRGGHHPTIGKRTVERMVRDFTPADPSEPWSMSDAEDGEAPLVLDVLGMVFRMTEGRVWLTKNLAEWIVRVRKSSPTIPANWAYVVARLYQAAQVRKDDVRCLDLTLAAKPWEPSRDDGGTWRASVTLTAADGSGLRKTKTQTISPAGSWADWQRDCERLGMGDQWSSIFNAWLMTLPDDDQQEASVGKGGGSSQIQQEDIDLDENANAAVSREMIES